MTTFFTSRCLGLWILFLPASDHHCKADVDLIESFADYVCRCEHTQVAPKLHADFRDEHRPCAAHVINPVAHGVVKPDTDAYSRERVHLLALPEIVGACQCERH